MTATTATTTTTTTTATGIVVAGGEARTSDSALDRFAALLAAPRSRRGVLALGAAVLAAAAPAPALVTAARRDGSGKPGVTRNARVKGSARAGAAAAAAAGSGIAMPALDPAAFAANPAINEFNLLMNRLIRNYEAWQAAIAAPVARANRQKVAALGKSVAADLGKIAGHEKTFLATGAATWSAAGAKMKEWGVDAELQKLQPGLTVDGVVSQLGANFGGTLAGTRDFYGAAKPAIAAEIALIRTQAAEVAASGVVTTRTPLTRSSAMRRVAAQAKTCKRVACILYVLAGCGLFLGVQVVVACVVFSTAGGPVGLAVCLGIIALVSALVLVNIANCLSLHRC
ncbi:MAG: hypothetical protein ACKOWF_15150 [Chloroflexota bacterium]